MPWIENMKSTSSAVPTWDSSALRYSSPVIPRFAIAARWTQEENLFKGVKLILIKNPRRDWSEMSRWKIKETIFSHHIAKPPQAVDMENDTIRTREFSTWEVFWEEVIMQYHEPVGKVTTLRHVSVTSQALSLEMYDRRLSILSSGFVNT